MTLQSARGWFCSGPSRVAPRRLVAGALAVIVVLGAACSSSESQEDVLAEPTVSISTTSQPTTTASPTTTGPPSTTTVPDSGSGDSGGSTATLPGEAVLDPTVGAIVAVVGVSHDALLSVYRLPDRNSELLIELDPTSFDLETTGAQRRVQDDAGTWEFWTELSTSEGAGWVLSYHVATLGAVATDPDITDWVIDQRFAGEAPFGDSPLEVAEVFALGMATHELDEFGPEFLPGWAAAPIRVVEGESEPVVVDVRTPGDDSQLGLRLEIAVEEMDGRFVLTGVVARSSICARGGETGGPCL